MTASVSASLKSSALIIDLTHRLLLFRLVYPEFPVTLLRCWIIGVGLTWSLCGVSGWELRAVEPDFGFEAAGDEAAADAPRRLPRPTTTKRSPRPSTSANSGSGWGTTFSGLVIVLALFGGCVWMFRRSGAQWAGILPAEVIQVLGKRYLDQRQCVQLVRIGSRILVLAQSHQHGLNTLAEITDPVEIDLIAGQCRQASPQSLTRSFAELLSREQAPSETVSPPPAGPVVAGYRQSLELRPGGQHG